MNRNYIIFKTSFKIKPPSAGLSNLVLLADCHSIVIRSHLLYFNVSEANDSVANDTNIF